MSGEAGGIPYLWADKPPTINVTGGGGGGTALVAWGPNFGEPQELTVGMALSNPSLGVLIPQTTGSHLTNPANAINVNAQTTGNHLSGSVLGAPFWQAEAHQANTAAGTSITVNKPSGVVQGDLMLAFIDTAAVTGGAPFVQQPGGWTFITNNFLSSAATSVWRKVAGASEPSNYLFGFFTDGTFTTPQSVDQAAAEINSIKGFNTTTPINVTAGANGVLGVGNPADPPNPSVTTTVVNCLVFAHLWHSHLALSQTHTAPASHAEATDFESNVTAVIYGSTTDWRVFAAAAATGTATHDCTETVNTDWMCLRVAVAPGSLVIA